MDTKTTIGIECVLKNQEELLQEHADLMKKRPELSVVLPCALFGGRQICSWCCLHIRDLAFPPTRNEYAEKHPAYYKFISEYTKRDWDDIWSTCSGCFKD